MMQYLHKTLPEAQRTQGIEFITQIIFMTDINLISSSLKEKEGISDSNIFDQSHSKCKCITDSIARIGNAFYCHS